MRRFLLGLVVLILYLIQTPVDSDDSLQELKLDSDLQEEIDDITDTSERAKVQERYLDIFKRGHSKGYATGHTKGYATGHTEGYATGHSTGHATGRATGHSEGIAVAEGDNFLSSFECATHGLKGVLEEGYKFSKTFSTSVITNKFKYLQIPPDILRVIKTKDKWVRIYNSYKVGSTTTEETMNFVEEVYFAETLNSSTVLNSVEEIKAATNEPKKLDAYQAGIEESFRNWYALLKFQGDEKTTPTYIKDLRNLLKKFLINNVARYSDIDQVHLRFAAHMARSYKMMCALHHQMNNIIRSYAEKHKDMEFTQILNIFAPGWYMSDEQFQFLNILRLTLPRSLSSLNRILVKNGMNDGVVLPYDHSTDCARVMFNKISTNSIELTTFVTVIPDIPVD